MHHCSQIILLNCVHFFEEKNILHGWVRRSQQHMVLISSCIKTDEVWESEKYFRVVKNTVAYCLTGSNSVGLCTRFFQKLCKSFSSIFGESIANEGIVFCPSRKKSKASVYAIMVSNPRPRINRQSTRRLARAGNLCLFTAAYVDFIDIFLI